MQTVPGNNLSNYNEWHQHYNKSIVGMTELKMMIWHKTVLAMLSAENLAGKKILEVGCGNGDFANYLSINRSADIIATDFSTASIEIAEEKKRNFGAHTSTFMVADAQALPFEDNSFDYVISCECLEHVPSPQQMLNEIFRVLKKGGRVILTTENYSNAYAYYIPYLKMRGRLFDSGSGLQPIEHFFVFWRVRKKFKKAGFSQITLHGKQYVMLLLPGFSPDTFTIQETKNSWLKRILKPFARRMTYSAVK